MNLRMYSVYDRSAMFHFPPFFVRSDAEAKRAFESILKSPERTGTRGEFDLCCLAVFDDQTGLIVDSGVSLLLNGSAFDVPSTPI